MGVNSLDINVKYLTENNIKDVDLDVEENNSIAQDIDASIFINPSVNSDIKISDDDILDGDETVSQAEILSDELSSIKEQQGFIGNVWDGIKNIFNMKNGSKNVENLIKQVQNGEISLDEAKERLEGYKEGQKMCVDIAGDIISGITAVGAAALAPVTGGLSLVVAAGAGSLTKIGIKAGDAVIGGRDYNLADIGYDAITGGINGVMAPLSNAIGGAAGTCVAKAVGLEAAETCAKTAIKEAGEEGIKQVGKSFFTKLLAKQGMKYVAKEGAKEGASVVAGKILAYGADMTIDGALSGATDGFARALAQGRTEDIPSDFLTGAVAGAAGGLIIGGASKLIFKGASTLGSKLATNAGDETVDTIAQSLDNAALRNLDEIALGVDTAASKTVIEASRDISGEASFFFKNIDDALEHLSKNPDKRALDIISAAKKAVKKGEMDNNTILRRLNLAIDVLEEGQNYEQIKQISNNLNNVLTSDTFTRDTVQELYDALGTSGKIIYNPEKKLYISDSEYGHLTARAKGSESIFSKIRNKIFDLKTDLPETIEDAHSLIGDAQGTRLILKNADNGLEIIKQKAFEKLQDEDKCNLFIKYLNNEATQVPDELLSKFKEYKIEILNAVNEKQTDDFVNNLANAMKLDKIRVTELHNYSAQNGVPYLNADQTARLQDAYDIWFNNAKEGKYGNYTPITNEKGFVTGLLDTNGNEFKAKLIIESPDVAAKNNPAVKENGYTAAQFNIITKAGQNEELQFRGSSIDSLAECEHMVYDLKKGKETVSGPEYDKIRNIITKMKETKISGDDKNSVMLIDEYSQYFSKVFETCRKRELGIINATMPEISSFKNLSNMLTKDELDIVSINGLINLHSAIDAAKTSLKQAA